MAKWEFVHLLNLTNAKSRLQLYESVELGVPASHVPLLATATGRGVSELLDLLAMAETTYRRKEGENKPLPAVDGQRVMALIRVSALVKRLLDESGDAAGVATFDLGAWIGDWIARPLPELGGRRPAEMLRNAEGVRAVEGVLERMRGGVPA